MKEISNQKSVTRKGFTTLEIILVVALLSLIVVAIAPFFRTTVAGWELKDRQLEILQNGRVGMDEMIKTIKTATGFDTVDADHIKFSDVNEDDVEFKLQNEVLQKKETGTGWEALAEPVDSLTFTYYDKNGNVTSDSTQTRSVKIAMVISDSEGKVDSVTFNSQVTPRKDFAVYSVAINEINYNPPQGGASERRNEWIELYNYGESEIDLTGWTISDSANTDNLETGDGTMTISAGGYAIITANDTEVYDNYTVAESAIRLQVDDTTIGNGLGDNGDTITITDADGNNVDSVTYDEDWGGYGDGDTIERKDAESAPSEPSNWEASSETGTYTAGSANSVSP